MVGRPAATALALATLATSGVAGCGQQRRPPPDHAGPAALRWLPTAAIRGAVGRQLDGAAIATASGAIHVAVVSRTASRDSEVRVLRLDGDRWVQTTPPGRPLRVTRDARVDLVGGTRPCVVAPWRGVVRVRCLTGGRWVQDGRGVFRETSTSSYAGAHRHRGRLIVLGITRGRGGDAHRGLEIDAYRRSRHGGWTRRPERVAPAGRGGAQRPHPVSHRGRLCVAYDRIPPASGGTPSVQVRCATDRTWRGLGAALAPPVRTSSVMSVDGAVSTAEGLFVGVDVFDGPRADWQVLLHTDGRWRPTTLGGHDPAWNEQGTLFAIGGDVWAVRFDQQPAGGGLRGRLVVLRRTRDGATEQVGAPLRAPSPIVTPLYYGLAEAHGRVYALATVPDRAHDGDRVVVSRLSRPLAATAGEGRGRRGTRAARAPRGR